MTGTNISPLLSLNMGLSSTKGTHVRTEVLRL